MKIQDVVTDESAAKALNYLSETDEEYAKAKGRLDIMSKAEKVIVADGFLKATGGADARKHEAHAGDLYIEWVDDYENTVVDFTLLRAKRERAVSMLDLWRSISSARNKGHV